MNAEPSRTSARPFVRTLLLLPGMDGSSLLFEPLTAAASADVRTLTVPYPPGEKNAYEDLLPLVTSALPTDGPFYLLGWSFSGPMALMVARSRPPGLRGVILASSFVRRPVPLPSWFRHLARPSLFRLYPSTYQARALLSGAEIRQFRAVVGRAHEAAGPVALACRVRAAMAVDARELLKDCPVPVLYLAATQDRLVAGKHAAEARALLPSVRVAEIPGPHMALVTNPAASWAALGAFMDAVDLELES